MFGCRLEHGHRHLGSGRSPAVAAWEPVRHRGDLVGDSRDVSDHNVRPDAIERLEQTALADLDAVGQAQSSCVLSRHANGLGIDIGAVNLAGAEAGGHEGQDTRASADVDDGVAGIDEEALGHLAAGVGRGEHVRSQQQVERTAAAGPDVLPVVGFHS